MKVDRTKDAKYDVRIVNWNLEHERVSRKEYDKFLKTLPDVAENAVPVEAELTPVEIPGVSRK
ncbi:MAG: hypothetical protein J7M25_18735 [Deltaproteobacteria bacterium]|nr:hypothetical protein [Deltaproteobacteria bacterium]